MSSSKREPERRAHALGVTSSATGKYLTWQRMRTGSRIPSLLVLESWRWNPPPCTLLLLTSCARVTLAGTGEEKEEHILVLSFVFMTQALEEEIICAWVLPPPPFACLLWSLLERHATVGGRLSLKL